MSMRTYLRIINPIMAALVLLLCLYAATFDKGKFEPGGVLEGNIPMYFVAKGLFCSSALFILGRILLILMTKSEDKGDKHGNT